MLVRISEDWMGNVTACPVSEANREAIAADMERNGANPSPENGTLFLQQPSIEEVRDTFGPRAVLTSRRWRGICTPEGQVNDGATIRVDDWEFRQRCGYSCG